MCIRDRNNLYRYALPEEYGGWGLSEKEILQVQEEFSRGPGGMRMHLHLSLIHISSWRSTDAASPNAQARFAGMPAAYVGRHPSFFVVWVTGLPDSPAHLLKTITQLSDIIHCVTCLRVSSGFMTILA